MSVAGDMRRLKHGWPLLGYDDRITADAVIRKWDTVRRLSQLEQLKVDQLLESIKTTKEKQHGTSNKV